MTSFGGFEMENADLIVAKSESALQMRVAEKSNLRGGVEKTVERLRGGENIFVFIAEGAVNHDETILVEWAGGKLLEPFSIFGAQLIARPQSNGARDGIEIVSVGQPGAGFIVITPNGKRADFADAINYFVGIGAVADYVAETDYFFPMAFRGSEGGVECSQVGVDIAENQIAHATAPRGRMRIIDEDWTRCTKSRVGILVAPRKPRAGWPSADQHAVAVAVKAILGCYRMAIGSNDVFLSGEGGDQRQETRFREMEIGEELIDDAERLAGIEENRGLVFSRSYCGAGAALGRLFGASSRARTTVVPTARIGLASLCAFAIACAVASGIS